MAGAGAGWGHYMLNNISIQRKEHQNMGCPHGSQLFSAGAKQANTYSVSRATSCFSYSQHTSGQPKTTLIREGLQSCTHQVRVSSALPCFSVIKAYDRQKTWDVFRYMVAGNLALPVFLLLVVDTSLDLYYPAKMSNQVFPTIPIHVPPPWSSQLHTYIVYPSQMLWRAQMLI